MNLTIMSVVVNNIHTYICIDILYSNDLSNLNILRIIFLKHTLLSKYFISLI